MSHFHKFRGRRPAPPGKRSPGEEVEPIATERMGKLPAKRGRRELEQIEGGRTPAHRITYGGRSRADSAVSPHTHLPGTDEGQTSNSCQRSEAGIQSTSPQFIGPIRLRTQFPAAREICPWNITVAPIPPMSLTTAGPRHLCALFLAISS